MAGQLPHLSWLSCPFNHQKVHCRQTARLAGRRAGPGPCKADYSGLDPRQGLIPCPQESHIHAPEQPRSAIHDTSPSGTVLADLSHCLLPFSVRLFQRASALRGGDGRCLSAGPGLRPSGKTGHGAYVGDADNPVRLRPHPRDVLHPAFAAVGQSACPFPGKVPGADPQAAGIAVG